MRFYGSQEEDDDDMGFFNEDDDHDEDGDGEEEFAELLNEELRELRIAELSLVQDGMRQKLLKDAVSMLEKSFFWLFLGLIALLVLTNMSNNSTKKIFVKH